MTDRETRWVHLQDGAVDLHRQVIHKGDDTTSLTTREAELMRYLVARMGEAISRDELHREVWGYASTVVSRAVDFTVRRLRNKIEPNPSQPVHVLTVHGVGYKLEANLGSEQVAPAPTSEVQTVVEDPTSFVGRDADLEVLEESFDGGATLVTILGAPGTGKTRLARHYGVSQVSERTAIFCDLTEARSVEEMTRVIADALGISLRESDIVAEVGRAIAARGDALVILDNFEHLVSFGADTVAPWVRAAPDARFLVTSRERLRLEGEVCLELGPLPVDEATELFMDRARAVRLDFTADDDVVEKIVAKLDGLPLAIELAAARVTVLSAPGLLERLDSSLKLLGRGRRDAHARQATLRGAIDWSWQLLSEPEQEALAQCAVFRSGFTVDAAEEVLALSDDEEWVLDVVEALRDKSLLRTDDSPAGGLRFRMLGAVREFAKEQLSPEDRVVVEQRHQRFYLDVGRLLHEQLNTAAGVTALQRLVMDRDNLLAVHERALEPDPEAAIRAVIYLEPVFSTRGPKNTHRRLLDDAVRVSGAVPPALQSHIRQVRGEARRVWGQADLARDDLDAALTLAEEAGDEKRRAIALSSLGILDWVAGHRQRARERCEAALAMHQAQGNQSRESLMWVALGVMDRNEGDSGPAEEKLRKALRMQRDLGARRYEGVTLMNLGNLLRATDCVEEAEQFYRDALAIHTGIEDQRGQGAVLMNLASLLSVTGRYEEAMEAYETAATIARRGGEALAVAHLQHMIGSLFHLQGDHDAAERSFHEALSIVTEIGNRTLAASAEADLAALLSDQDRIHEAQTLFTRAEPDLVGQPRELALLDAQKGHLDLARYRLALKEGGEGESHLDLARERLSRARSRNVSPEPLPVQLLAKAVREAVRC